MPRSPSPQAPSWPLPPPLQSVSFRACLTWAVGLRVGGLCRADQLGCFAGRGQGPSPTLAGQAGLCVLLALLDDLADISSVVLFGACIEGVVLRDK